MRFPLSLASAVVGLSTLLFAAVAWPASSWAGEIEVDARVPVRLVLDGDVVADIFTRSTLVFPVTAGTHALTVVEAGLPTEYEVKVGEGTTRVLVGRLGTTVQTLEDATQEAAEAETEAAPAATGPAQVRFRTTHGVRLMVQLAGQRTVIGPGEGQILELPLGTHRFNVRTVDGTAILARGLLEVSQAAEGQLVQLAEGAIPEVSGDGLAYLLSSP